MYNPDAANDAVKKGASVLDRYFEGSRDWRKDIDVDKLDLSSDTNCPLGQLFDGYTNGTDTLKAELGVDAYRDEYGFSDWGAEDVSYRDMTKAWVAYLTPSNPCGEVAMFDPEQVHIVYRYIPDPTNPRAEMPIVVMVTKNEDKAGGAVQALNHAGIKCRKSTETLT